MRQPREIDPLVAAPNPRYADEMEALANDISELSAHIAAATFQLLEMLAIFDEREGWALHGCGSCAHWLQWKCGTNLGAALEKAMGELFDERKGEAPDVSARTPNGGLPEYEQPDPVAAGRADALERLAEAFLAGGHGRSCGGDHYLVNVHATVAALQADGDAADAECEGCGNVSAETSARSARGIARKAWTSPRTPWPVDGTARRWTRTSRRGFCSNRDALPAPGPDVVD